MKTITDDNLRKIIIPGILGEAVSTEFFCTVEELANLAPMSEFVRLGIDKNDQELLKIMPNTLPSLFGFSYALPQYCSEEKHFMGACYAFKILNDIKDDKPRMEILTTAMLNLFNRANLIDATNLPKKIVRSAAYKAMRKDLSIIFEDMELLL